MTVRVSSGNTHIFISYRRKDCGEIASKLHTALNSKYWDGIFMDIDNIQFGDDFEKRIKKVISECKVILILIGKDWLKSFDEKHQAGEKDYVKAEITMALRFNQARIIPVLIDDARFPMREELPVGLRTLAKFNAGRLRSDHFEEDFNRLTRDLDEIMEKIQKMEKLNLLVAILSCLSCGFGFFFPPLFTVATILFAIFIILYFRTQVKSFREISE